MFFKRAPKETPDELANRLQRESKLELLEEELQRYDLKKLAPRDRESWYHLWGINAFRQGNRTEAFQRFQEGIANFPESKKLLFSLGQEFEHRREIEGMFNCFDRCSFPNNYASQMLCAARYAYLWDRPDKGRLYVQPVAEAYFPLGIADDHFVFMRGLPFFEQTWAYLVTFALLTEDFVDTDAYLKRAEEKLADYDFTSTRRFYDCAKLGDYAAAIANLERQLAEWEPRFTSGYHNVKLAALRAESAPDLKLAIRALNVSIGPNDHQWLNDVLILHRAWAHGRFDDPDQEQVLLEVFVARQAMLFEPDHAYHFAFLPYQESLKKWYQSTKA